MGVLKLIMSAFDVYHWTVVAVLSLLVIHWCYEKVLKMLLLRMSVSGRLAGAFIDSMWNLCFKILSLYLTFQYLRGSWGFANWKDRLNDELTLCKMKTKVGHKYQPAFALLTAFMVQELIDIFMTYGYRNYKSFLKQLFLAVFLLTNYSRCSVFGLSLVFIANWPEVFEAASKLLLVISKHTDSNRLRFVSKCVLGYSVYLWIMTYLYIVPTFLTYNKSIESSMMKANLNMLIVMDGLTWIYLVLTIVTSVFTRMVLSFVVPSEERPRTLEFCLFGCDPWVLIITACRSLEEYVDIAK